MKRALPVAVLAIAGVLYDPDMPSRVRISSFQALWLGAALSGGLGLLCVGALVAFLRLRAAAPDI